MHGLPSASRTARRGERIYRVIRFGAPGAVGELGLSFGLWDPSMGQKSLRRQFRSAQPHPVRVPAEGEGWLHDVEGGRGLASEDGGASIQFHVAADREETAV